MRIALLAMGSRGDVQPLASLALDAQRDGHEAVLHGPPDHQRWIHSLGLAYRPFGGGIEALLRANASVTNSGFLRATRRINRVFVEQIAEQFALVPEALRDADAVFGCGLVLAGRSVAEARRIPYATVVTCPTLLRSSEHLPLVFPWHSLPRAVNRAAWSASDLAYDALLLPGIRQGRAALGLATDGHAYGYMVSDDTVLAAETALAPLPEDASARCFRAGYRDAPDDRALDPAIDAFLREGSAPVYVGFGSMPDEHPDETTQIALAAARAVGRRLVLSRGAAGLGAGLREPDAIVIDDAPHARLFARVAAVVHHGGAGTTHAAARAGAAQIVVSHMLDQSYWGRRVRELGIGPAPIERRSLRTDALTRALTEALSERCVVAARTVSAQWEPPRAFESVLRWVTSRARC